MDLNEARELVQNGCANWPRLVEAAWTISELAEASLADLLAYLAHRGLPSEYAAMNLYLRTERPRADEPWLKQQLNRRVRRGDK